MQEFQGSSRRRFLRRAGASGTLIVFGLAPLAACGGKSGEGGDTGEVPGGGNASPAAPPCTDLSDLRPEQKEWREDAGYVQQTPDPAQRCDNCEYWVPPAEGSPCGGCTLMAGPIAPGAWCDLWEEQEEA